MHRFFARDAALVAELLHLPEALAAQLLDDLEAAGCVESAVGPDAVAE